MFSPGFQSPVRGHGRPLHPHLPPGTCHSCARDIQHVQTLELITNIPLSNSQKTKKPRKPMIQTWGNNDFVKSLAHNKGQDGIPFPLQASGVWCSCRCTSQVKYTDTLQRCHRTKSKIWWASNAAKAICSCFLNYVGGELMEHPRPSSTFVQCTLHMLRFRLLASPPPTQPIAVTSVINLPASGGRKEFVYDQPSLHSYLIL